jgi:hypothetical protein
MALRSEKVDNLVASESFDVAKRFIGYALGPKIGGVSTLIIEEKIFCKRCRTAEGGNHYVRWSTLRKTRGGGRS